MQAIEDVEPIAKLFILTLRNNKLTKSKEENINGL